MTIRLYDSVTRQVGDFTPLRPGQASIYVCGLTVQSEPHVGHVRSAVNFDVLRRWLTYRGLEVNFIRNLTDIDDKILAKAAEQGRAWYNLAYEMTGQLTEAYRALNVLPPTYEPLATGHIPEMVELIGQLIDRGHAYAAPVGGADAGDVYFDVRSWPAYGSLTGQRLGDLAAAEDADPRGKRDPRDFALWKGAKPGEPATASWPSPWGRGRPGWHIECSAMAGKYLGESFDIHGGGVDLRFPHHENEQAQSRAAGHGFAQVWMHNAWITTAGEKMSKSLGNSLAIPAVLADYRAIDLRFYMVAAHYRSHVEFSFEALSEAAAGFARIEGFLARATRFGGADSVPTGAELPPAFASAMDDDLSTPAAVAVIHEVTRAGNRSLDEADADAVAQAAGEVQAMLGVLGLDPLDSAFVGSSGDAGLYSALDSLVSSLLTTRNKARSERDYATADLIRDQLSAAGVTVADGANGADGSTWSI